MSLSQARPPPHTSYHTLVSRLSTGRFPLKALAISEPPINIAGFCSPVAKLSGTPTLGAPHLQVQCKFQMRQIPFPNSKLCPRSPHDGLSGAPSPAKRANWLDAGVTTEGCGYRARRAKSRPAPLTTQKGATPAAPKDRSLMPSPFWTSPVRLTSRRPPLPKAHRPNAPPETKPAIHWSESRC